MPLEQLRAAITEERLIDLQIAFAETPGPTFHEEQRAELIASLWRDVGLEPSSDGAGNVFALRPEQADGPRLVVAAHLDSVFPMEQDIRVRRPGEVCDFCGDQLPAGEYHGPGIGDCAAGLAAITMVAEALQATAYATGSPLLFVATVGEEGAGDLRGARALFDGPQSERIGAFITVDTGARGFIVHEATASRRYRVTFQGPGGHAWADFGMYSPIHAAGDAIARIGRYRAPTDPRTSFNVGIVEGGRSVNAIPEEASFDLDLRSVDHDQLSRLTAYALQSIDDAHKDQQSRTRGESGYRAAQFGERPGGSIPVDHPLVAAAAAALRDEGIEPRYGPGSTDANIPLARGIPAIAFPWGGISRGAHSVHESFQADGRVEHVRALARLAATWREDAAAGSGRSPQQPYR